MDVIHYRWLTLWITFTPNTPLRHRVAFSRYVSTLNENTDDRASSPIEEPNLKDSPARWENLLCETLRKANFLKKGEMVISVKIRNFYRSRVTKWTSRLESSCEI